MMWLSVGLLSCMLAATYGSTIPAEYRQTPPEYRQAHDFVGEVQHLVDGMGARTSRAIDSDFNSPSERSIRPKRQNQQPNRLAPYRFGYAVKDDEGNDYNQQEQSDGTKITGQYSVLLPDGRIQTVTYSVAPDTGFVADVTYTQPGRG